MPPRVTACHHGSRPSPSGGPRPAMRPQARQSRLLPPVHRKRYASKSSPEPTPAWPWGGEPRQPTAPEESRSCGAPWPPARSRPPPKTCDALAFSLAAGAILTLPGRSSAAARDRGRDPIEPQDGRHLTSLARPTVCARGAGARPARPRMAAPSPVAMPPGEDLRGAPVAPHSSLRKKTRRAPFGHPGSSPTSS